MQDALPAFVLSSEARFKVMSVSPVQPQADPAAVPSPSDERLMLAFSQGSAEAFAELFSRYKQPGPTFDIWLVMFLLPALLLFRRCRRAATSSL